MTAPLLVLVALTLLLYGGVASLPAVVRQPVPRSQPLALAAPRRSLWVVQAPDERWYLDGLPIPRADLAARLRRDGRSARIHYLPSGLLAIGQIRHSLRWLRQGGAAVVVELPQP